MSLSKAMGRRLGVEMRLAQRGRKSNKERGTGGKVCEGVGRAEADGDNHEVYRLWSAWHMTMGRTNSEVHGKG